MADKQAVRNVNPSRQQPLPHRQQTAVRLAASAAPSRPPAHQITPSEGSTTCSAESSDEGSEVSTASKISSRISTSNFSKNEELPRKCLVVRRSAPKTGVTKTEIRLVIYNETQKKEGLRKMEYPALMDASEMLADRLRDLETKNNKDAYQKEKEVRRQLEGESRPTPTPDNVKAAIAKLKKVAPSLCNASSELTTTTATPIGPASSSSPCGSIRVEPNKNPRRNRSAKPAAPAKPTVAKPTVPPGAPTTTDAESKSSSASDDSQASKTTSLACLEKNCCMQQPCTKGGGRPAEEAPKKHRKRRTRKRSGDRDSLPRTAKVSTSPRVKRALVAPVDSDDSSAPRPLRAKPVQTQSDPCSDSDSDYSAKPLRKPPPHAIRERKKPKPKNSLEPVAEASEPGRPKKAQDEEPKGPTKPSEPRRPKKAQVQPKDDEPKGPIESSEPRRPKKERDQAKDEGPKGPKGPEGPTETSEPRRPKKTRIQPKEDDTQEDHNGSAEPDPPRRPKKDQDQAKGEEPKEEPKGAKGAKGPDRTLAPLCDRRDCCMQQPCVKKGRKEQPAESDQPTVTEKAEEAPSGKRGKKNKKRTDIVISDDTSVTNNTNIEDSLYVLKRILKKLESSNSLKLKNNPDKEKVKAQIEKIIRAVEGKLANGTKLNADDLDRMKRIVAKTAELRNVSLTTTVTVTESVSVEDEDTN